MTIWRKLRSWWEGSGDLKLYDEGGKEFRPHEHIARIEELEEELRRAKQGLLDQRVLLRKLQRGAEALKRDWPPIHKKYFNERRNKP